MRHVLVFAALVLGASTAAAEEPDHAIHEELRAVVAEASEAIGSGRYEAVLPLITEDFRGTSLTQAPIVGRDGVRDYFALWFGPDGYMESMAITITPDTLTELSEDRSWGLVTGSAKEHYVAKNGDVFDFDSRWTTVMVRDTDGEWRVRAIHFGTNHLDNPVLWKVRQTVVRYGAVGAVVLVVVAFGLGFLVGRRRSGAV
jgi:ketosteroid isomerase-like protein